MNETHGMDNDLEALREQLGNLRAELEGSHFEIETLTRELNETNNGVIALYAELDDRAEDLRHATDLKSRFLSYMSHEFRTPLSSIANMSRILLEHMDGPLTAEQEKQVSFVRDGALELTDMVNDLLDLAKVEAGRITISPAWFEMVDLFAALRGMFRPILTKESVDLIFEEPPPIPQLYTDHKKLSQILRNFISNALKFTIKGEVRVSIANFDGTTVTFAVVDTGIGIAQEHQNTLFNDFVQLDSAVQKRLRGTGLGLSLSKKLAELLGGKVWVQSELGAGATFFLAVPVCLRDHGDTHEDQSNTGAEARYDAST